MGRLPRTLTLALTLTLTPRPRPHQVPKTADEIDRIKAAVRANFLFQHLNETQAQQVYDVMKRVPVKRGEVVIRQGDAGDWFYVVDSGEFAVSLNQAGKQVEILKYTTQGGTNPCFGELALMPNPNPYPNPNPNPNPNQVHARSEQQWRGERRGAALAADHGRGGG